MRNFSAAHEAGYYPLIHCGTSYGHYKDVREELIHHTRDLRHQVRDVLAKLGKKMVMPEEIVHYSEWFYAMKERIAEKQVLDFSGIATVVHPACHYYKLVEGDAIYDPDIYGGQRTAIVTRCGQGPSEQKSANTPPGSTAAASAFATSWCSATSPDRLPPSARSRS